MTILSVESTLRTRFIPVLLLRGGGLYKTVRFKNPVYVGDPMNAVRIFNEKAVDELVLLSIDSSNQAAGPDLPVIADIVSEAFVPICYGGGVTNLEQCEALFKIGVEKVAINSAATGGMDLISQAARVFGSQSVVVGIDVKKTILGKYERYVQCGRISSGELAVAAAKQAEAAGCGELLLQSMDRDGTMKGYDIGLVKQVSESVSIPVIACGGASSVADMARAIREGGASSAAAGSIFVFRGKHKAVLITYPDESSIAAAMLEASQNIDSGAVN